jgi:serine/threonine-protein kinase RsbW
MLAEAIQFKIPAQRSELKPLRENISAALKEAYIHEEDCSLCTLAVDEIISNKIIHACGEDPNLEINVILQVNTEQIIFSIDDNGIPFDHSKYNPPTIKSLIAGRSKGSLGMLIVHKIMDRVEFRTVEQTNTCILYRNR